MLSSKILDFYAGVGDDPRGHGREVISESGVETVLYPS